MRNTSYHKDRNLVQHMATSGELVQIIRDRWKAIGSNRELAASLIDECKRHTDTGGGVIWIKYESIENNDGSSFTWAFVPKGSTMWDAIPRFVTTFSEISKDYDPSKHCLLFMTIPRSDEEKSYGQMVRINYDTTVGDSGSEVVVGSDGSWNFRL